MSKGNRKAVAYVRANLAANIGADRDSLGFQKTAIYGYAKATGYEIVATCYDDDASGADPIHRFGYTKMLERLLSEGAQTIIVESSDRFARDPVVQLAGHEALKAEGISLIAASAPTYFVETTPTAVLIRKVLNTVAGFDEATRIAKKAAAVQKVVIPGEIQAVVEDLEEKGFQIRPRLLHDGSLRFYVWGGPAEAKHVHIKQELTAEQMTGRYHLWLTVSSRRSDSTYVGNNAPHATE
jgi:DNA invertase Pin-like site-specific DNA recombinase